MLTPTMFCSIIINIKAKIIRIIKGLGLTVSPIVYRFKWLIIISIRAEKVKISN